MHNIDYAGMSDQALKQHFLRNRGDKLALRAYLDRLGDRPHQIITTVDDPDFDTKIEAAILKKMQQEDSGE
jgi:hypothetical protein